MLKLFNNPKFIIIFTVFVDIVGYGIVIPVLPFYVRSFGASDFIITLLFSVFSLFAFISAPFLGTLSDRIGRRPVLLISIASTALGWIIFASAISLPLLFLGRIIDGLAAGNLSTAQSYLVDMSKTDKERTENLGLIGSMFGVGLIIGPLIGGFLGSISHTLPFWTVGILATFNVILAYFRLPETHHDKGMTKKIEINPILPIVRAFSDKKLLPGYISWFLFGSAVASQQSVFTLYINRVFGYEEFISGLFLTGIGITLSINQAVLLKRFWLQKFKEPDLELYLMLLFSIAFLVMSVPSVIIFIIGIIFSTLSQSILRVVMTSQMAGANIKKQGETLGMMTSVMSLSMIVAPIISGMLFTYHYVLPFIFSSIILSLAFILIILNRRKLEFDQREDYIVPQTSL
jgi:MFS transporter, DHA1 family, tetracycline resistance protein